MPPFRRDCPSIDDNPTWPARRGPVSRCQFLVLGKVMQSPRHAQLFRSSESDRSGTLQLQYAKMLRDGGQAYVERFGERSVELELVRATQEL